VERFNKWSESYDRSFLRAFFTRVHRRILEEAATHQPHPESILDVGCGTGRLLRAASARWPGARLTGVDPAVGMVEVARRTTPGAVFHLGRAESLPVPDAWFDVVLTSLSFHHWTDQTAGLREITRALRGGGFFYLADVIAPRWLATASRSRIQSRAGLQRLFAGAGLRVETQSALFTNFVVLTVGVRR